MQRMIQPINNELRRELSLEEGKTAVENCSREGLFMIRHKET